ncbi:MAG: SH3 domain-containing protein [Anaerolineae bacterium]
MRRYYVVLLLVVLGLLAGVLNVAQAQQGTWYAQFYNNRYLVDPVVRSRQDRSINFDWGAGSPVDGVNADGFSARWTRTVTLGGGTYQISARADDGIRVLIDNVSYIDDFFPGTGRQHNVVFTLMGGDHIIEVEYQENTGGAFINFDFDAYVAPTALATLTPQAGLAATDIPYTPFPTIDPNGPVLTVTVGRLNVRSLPSTNGRILTSIQRYESYPIIGRSISGDWYQIVVDNLRVVGVVVGWVSAEFVNVIRADAVPVTYGFEGEPILTNYYLRTTANVVLRTAPSTASEGIGLLFGGVRLQIAGITSDGYWWLVYIEGFLGWVNHDFVALEQDVDYGQIPVVDAFVADNPFSDQ